VHLSVTRGEKVAQVAQVDSRFLLGTRDWTEVEVPAHTSALGKVFYAWGALPIPKTGLERLTDATIVEPDELRREGARARKRGWAVTCDELEVGLTGVAVPVQGARGDVVAALGISGPTQRLEDRLDEVGRSLSSHAAQLSSLLRGRNPASTNHKEGVA
jgi:DNA-binding IclR family transcriptional regulator